MQEHAYFYCIYEQIIGYLILVLISIRNPPFIKNAECLLYLYIFLFKFSKENEEEEEVIIPDIRATLTDYGLCHSYNTMVENEVFNDESIRDWDKVNGHSSLLF